MSLKHCPYRILIGPFTDNPIYNNPSLLGDYAEDPQIRYLVNPPHLARSQDIGFTLQDTWGDVLNRLPTDWQPDVIIWWDLIFQGLPLGIEAVQCPILAVVCDWNLGWQTTWGYTQVIDGLLGDQALVNLLRQQGYTQVAYFPSYSFNPRQHQGDIAAIRAWDVAFVGNLNPYVQAQRSHYLARLAELSSHYKITIQSGIFGPAYTDLLAQSRIVFNHSVRGEMNMRAYEAPACGAMLMMEESNLEIRDFLTDGESCILYNANNFEEKIHHYLTHEDERLRIARCGQQQILAHSYTSHFEKLLALLPLWLEQGAQKYTRSQSEHTVAQRLRDARQLCQAATPGAYQAALAALEPHLFQSEKIDLSHHSPEILNALAVLLARDAQTSSHWNRAEQLLQLALTQAPNDLIPTYNLAWILTTQGKNAALETWQGCLKLLDSASEPSCWHGFVLPLRFDEPFGMAWEKSQSPVTTGSHSGLHWRALLRGQCWFQIGQLLQHKHPVEAMKAYEESLKHWMTHGEAWFRLGEVYAHLNQPDDTSTAFQHAVALNPLSMQGWPIMLETLIEQDKWVVAWVLAQTWNTQLVAFGSELNGLKSQIQALYQWLDLKYQMATTAEIAGAELLQRLLGPWPMALFERLRHWWLDDLLPHVPLLWPLLDPIVIYWPNDSVEPCPPLSPAWLFFRSEHPSVATWQISWAESPTSPGQLQRVYTAETHPYQLGPRLLPPLFPPMAAITYSVTAPHGNWKGLIIASGLSMASLAQLIHTCLALEPLDSGAEWIIWWPTNPPTDQDWLTLEPLLPAGDLPVTFWPEPLSVAETMGLLQQVQAIVGQPGPATNYWLWWGLSLGHLVWPWADEGWQALTEQIYGVSLPPLAFGTIPLSQLWQGTTESRHNCQQAIQQWQQTHATERWHQGLWQLKILSLFGQDMQTP